MDIEVLDEKILYQNGPFRHVKRWLRGIHPSLGTITYGLTGWETIVEKTVIVPTRTYHVYENSNADQTFLRGADSQCFEQACTQENPVTPGVVGDAIQCDQGSAATALQAS